LPTNIDQVHFIENSIRGGLFFINTRHKKADNDGKLRYFDAINLYGLAQTGLLPYDNYRWLESSEVMSFNINETGVDGKYGYILEVDLKYPRHLHYEHNDYPLAPEQQKISFNDLSPYSQKCHLDLTGSNTYSSTKLMTTLKDKKKLCDSPKELEVVYRVRYGL
jgi:hypothetical protein